MTIPSIIYANYQPSQIKIENLGIALSDATNNTLNLTPTQYLIVGEKQYGKYSFIVDATGIAVNTSLPTRTNTAAQYAAYIDGDVYITGSLITSNSIIYGNTISGGGGGMGVGGVGGGVGIGGASGGSGAGISQWLYSDRNFNSIYYNGNVTLGNQFDSSNNPYTLNIVQSADRTIDHTQISIQNTEYSQLRFGIIGTNLNSPAIINTPPNTNLEFHIGRDQSYFTQLYNTSNYVTVYNDDGTTSNIIQITPDDIPHYEYYPQSTGLAPHIIIDTLGNVGIHTSCNVPINYNLRIRDPKAPQNIIFSKTTESMAVHVAGSTFSSNLLIFDYETRMPVNVDELYVRRLGATIPANQVNVGTFANGVYNFTSNVNLLNGDLNINGNETISQNLLVDGTSTLNQIIANDAILVDVASFCNDVYIQRDIIINHSIRVRGQIFTEMLSNIDTIDGIPRSNYAWQIIDFTPSSPVLSNINFTGNGFWTPGRVGIGATAGFNNQLSVFKYNTNIYELELHNLDPTLTYTSAVFIGHPAVESDMSPDGSLVIATPSLKDPNYIGQNLSGVQQNIYFFPGTDMGVLNLPIIRTGNPPTLGIFYNNTVGIGTYAPLSELDVRGTITFSGELHYYDESVNPAEIINVGLWKSKQFQSIDPYTSTSITFTGIQFQNKDSSNVAINVNPENTYALVVGGGGIKSYDGYYTGDNRKMVPWMDSTDFLTLLNNGAPPVGKRYGLFTYGNVGIGVPIPKSTLEIKSNYTDSTIIRLYQGDNSANPTTAIDFVADDIWRIQANNTANTLEFGYGAETFTNNSNIRALWMRGNQVVIGDSMNALNLTSDNLDPYATLCVGGNVAVKGTVNVTGGFKINSATFSNQLINATGNAYPVVSNDDVFIGGGNVVLYPSSGNSVVIGSPGFQGDKLGNKNTDLSLLRVYPDYTLSTSSPILATFHTIAKTGLLSIVDDISGNILYFGLVNSANSIINVGIGATIQVGNGINTSFGFFDQYGNTYLSFNKNATTDNYVGFGANDPQSIIHAYTQGSGSNMLKLTKFVYGQDSSAACPEMYFEKIYSPPTNGGIQQQPTSWTIKGPNFTYGQKLGFIYQDNSTLPIEKFCFTSNGCIGIGTSQPEFALDVWNTGTRGSLRLLNIDNAASAQILFESGSNIYGAGQQYDFRMVASNSQFTFDMQNAVTADITIFNVNNQGNIGFKSSADPNYELSVTGALNVTQGIYLNGARLFGVGGGSSSLDQGLPLAATNIFLEPLTQYNGGVVLNGAYPTSNLFHIYNGQNANFIVLDSLDETSSSAGEVQIHFRNSIQSYDYFNNRPVHTKNMYRMSMSNTGFQWEYWGNCTQNSQILSDHTYYSNVMKFAPSLRSGFTSEFDTIMYGSLTLQSAVPSLFLGNQGTISGSNGNIIINPNGSGNFGIGTLSPAYYTHIVNKSSQKCALHIDQNVTGQDAFHINTNNVNVLTVNNAGNVGIGSSHPRAPLDMGSGYIYNGSGSIGYPSYTFGSDNRTGVYLSSISTLGISAGGIGVISITPPSVNITNSLLINNIFGNQIYGPSLSVIQTSTNINNIVEINNEINKLIVVNSVGNVGIGTTLPAYPLHINGNAGFSGNLLPISTLQYDIGSPTQRWRELYLSGSTIDLGGTLISRIEPDGSVQLSDANGLQRLIANEIQLGNANSASIIKISIGANNNVQFSSINNATQQSVIFAPLFLSNNILSIGASVPGANTGTLNIVSNNNLPVAVLNQNSTGDILQLFAGTNQLVTVNQNGNLGIGTTTPQYPFTINASNATFAAYIKQNSNIGNVATFISANNNGLIINNTGYVGISTSTPHVPFHVEGSQFYNGFANFGSNVYINGSLEIYGDAIAHGNQIVDSDARLKEDIHKIDNALTKLKTLSGYTFKMKNNGKKSTGLIAQEVIRVLPEAVNTENEYLGLAYGNMLGLVIEAIKELSEDVERIKNMNNI